MINPNNPPPQGLTTEQIQWIVANILLLKRLNNSGGGSGGSILLQTNGVDNSSQTILNLIQNDSLRIQDLGGGSIRISCSNPIFQVNGVDLSDQGRLNLIDGINTTVVDNGSGFVQIDAFSSGSTALPETQIAYGSTSNTITSNAAFYYYPGGLNPKSFNVGWAGESMSMLMNEDAFGVGNQVDGIRLYVQDNGVNRAVRASVVGDDYLLIDTTNQVYSIGDIDGADTGTKITVDDSTQLINITNVPPFADDAAAAGGGLVTGDLYKTTTGGSTFLKILP